uniref:Uncharacterized protein n=1 Tax=uncultured marine microorganism HF4000_APKG3D20 TaxID=455549 RepID=B3T7B5_9ZZZZ|nr:hypothetical protein ALOHA_HF4000APKG3D20ctg1g22 [uncultured marine microorganism HF4000_APKG3D20]
MTISGICNLANVTTPLNSIFMQLPSVTQYLVLISVSAGWLQLNAKESSRTQLDEIARQLHELEASLGNFDDFAESHRTKFQELNQRLDAMEVALGKLNDSKQSKAKPPRTPKIPIVQSPHMDPPAKPPIIEPRREQEPEVPEPTSAKSELDELSARLDQVVRELQASAETVRNLEGEIDPGGIHAGSANAGVSTSQAKEDARTFLGNYYLGFDYTYDFSDSNDQSEHYFSLSKRKPLTPSFDFRYSLGTGWYHWPEAIGVDSWGYASEIPEHNQWEIGLGLGGTLHRKFNFGDSFIRSVDPFIEFGYGFKYYFETDYFLSSVMHGPEVNFGAEIKLSRSFSLIPRYGISEYTEVIQGGMEIDYEPIKSYGLTLCFFLSNGNILALNGTSLADSNGKSLGISYLSSY